MKIPGFRRRIAWLAGLGVISGLASTYAPETAEKFMILEVPLFQGLVFGLVIGFGLYRWGNASRVSALLALVVTIVAWIAAVRGFFWITDDGQTSLYLGALVAGAIGAAGTILGGALTHKRLRDPISWILTVGVGAIAGLLVVPEARSVEQDFLLLFVVWQAAVAACIGYALTRQAPKN